MMMTSAATTKTTAAKITFHFLIMKMLIQHADGQ
jgi:hypothetical protein